MSLLFIVNCWKIFSVNIFMLVHIPGFPSKEGVCIIKALEARDNECITPKRFTGLSPWSHFSTFLLRSDSIPGSISEKN